MKLSASMVTDKQLRALRAGRGLTAQQLDNCVRSPQARSPLDAFPAHHTGWGGLACIAWYIPAERRDPGPTFHELLAKMQIGQQLQWLREQVNTQGAA